MCLYGWTYFIIKIFIVTVSKESQDRSDFNSIERFQIDLVIIKQSGYVSIPTTSLSMETTQYPLGFMEIDWEPIRLAH